MALVVGDIVSVKDFQTYLGQTLLNVYFYQIAEVPAVVTFTSPEEEFLERFRVRQVAVLKAEQSELLTHNRLRLDNLTNGIDFAELTINDVGIIAGDPEPSFVAFNFILRRSTGLTRNGSKRIGGLSENSITGNSLNLTQPRIDNLQEGVGGTVEGTGGASDTFGIPVIVGRTLIDPLDPDSGYELDLAKINVVQGATLTGVSTQRTRKAGRGI